MKELHYYLQKLGLWVLVFLFLLSLVAQEMLLLLCIVLFFMGIYQLAHFLISLCLRLIKGSKIGASTLSYGFLLTTYLITWRYMFEAISVPLNWYLMSVTAIMISGFYFYTTKKKN